ncbi:hypothetical protein VNO77_20333 [Canavalia gladiata]|uniref:Uncharacterized protein n=1 Tax=Canavalia gladiata TaxID=3824 RepID=A0AAN9LSK7_CANGL
MKRASQNLDSGYMIRKLAHFGWAQCQDTSTAKLYWAMICTIPVRHVKGHCKGLVLESSTPADHELALITTRLDKLSRLGLLAKLREVDSCLFKSCLPASYRILILQQGIRDKFPACKLPNIRTQGKKLDLISFDQEQFRLKKHKSTANDSNRLQVGLAHGKLDCQKPESNSLLTLGKLGTFDYIDQESTK